MRRWVACSLLLASPGSQADQEREFELIECRGERWLIKWTLVNRPHQLTVAPTDEPDWLNTVIDITLDGLTVEFEDVCEQALTAKRVQMKILSKDREKERGESKQRGNHSRTAGAGVTFQDEPVLRQQTSATQHEDLIFILEACDGNA